MFMVSWAHLQTFYTFTTIPYTVCGPQETKPEANHADALWRGGYNARAAKVRRKGKESENLRNVNSRCMPPSCRGLKKQTNK